MSGISSLIPEDGGTVPTRPVYSTVRRAEAATARSSLDLLSLPYPFSQLGLLTASDFAAERRSRAGRSLPSINEQILEELHRRGVLVRVFCATLRRFRPRNRHTGRRDLIPVRNQSHTYGYRDQGSAAYIPK
jgi:hypothetical protein